MLAAPGKLLVDFGLRRAHGAEAGLMAARASYIAGFAGTATVLAGEQFGIPLFGTMAHSFIEAFDDEIGGFRDVRPHRGPTMSCCCSTPMTPRRRPAKSWRWRRGSSKPASPFAASGSTAAISSRCRRSVRAILDAGGLKDMTIFASGGLDEDSLARLRQGQARRSTASASAPASPHPPTCRRSTASTNCRNMPACRGASARKTRPPGPAASRCGGAMTREAAWPAMCCTLADHETAGEPLIHPVMHGGKRSQAKPSLDDIRKHAKRELESPAAKHCGN